MKYQKLLLLMPALFLASCSSLWTSAGSTPPGSPKEYVEVSNPMQTMTPEAPATVWVPASSESGIPRGGELVKQGVSQLKQEMSGTGAKTATAPPSAPAAVPPAPAGTVVPAPPISGQTPAQGIRPVVQYQAIPQPTLAQGPIRKRIAIIESGQNGLIAPFSDQIRVLGIGVPIDLSATVSSVVKEQERPTYAGELWKDNVSSVLVVVSAPDGSGVGAPVTADIYDGIEKSRLRRVTTIIPAPAGSDRVSRDATLATALADLALRVGDVVNLTPWYGRIFAVEGERVYLNAGRESGVLVGQKLKVYRGGKVIPGIGYDPGTQVGMLEIAGFVGTNGSYGVVKDNKSIIPSDTVSYE